MRFSDSKRFHSMAEQIGAAILAEYRCELADGYRGHDAPICGADMVETVTVAYAAAVDARYPRTNARASS